MTVSSILLFVLLVLCRSVVALYPLVGLLLRSFPDVCDAFFPGSDMCLCLCGSDFACLMCPMSRCDLLMPPM